MDCLRMRPFGKVVVLALAVPMMGFLSGCQGLVVGKVVNEVKGVSPQLTVIKDPEATAMLEYQTVKVEPFKNQMGDSVPYYAPEKIRKEVIRQITRSPQVYELTGTTSPNTLIIQGTIIHYQTSKGLSKAIGGFYQLICHIRLIDGKTGAVIGEANCGGFSKAMVRSDFEDMSKGVGKSVRKWLTRSSKDDDDQDN